MVRERRKRKAMTKYFCFCCHPTSSFRTTYTKYATSSSSLLSKKRGKKRSTASVRKKTQSNARNARPIPIKKRPNIRYKTKKFPYKSNEKLFALFCVLVSLS